MSMQAYAQYGCGWSSAEGWRNFDASPTLRFERLPLIGRLYTRNAARFPDNVEFGDVVRGLPLPDGGCKAVYCSHILEHLSLTDCQAALRETHRVLQNGGVFRLVLPDLAHHVMQYVQDESTDAAHRLMRETGLGYSHRPRGLKALLTTWLGNSAHLWMWDYPALSAELAAAGFTNIRRARYGDAADPMFARVEQQERWENCLGIECFKPE